MNTPINIYLHLGASKTGTSIIQNFFDVNRTILAESRGYLYPNFSQEEMHKGRYHNHAPWYISSMEDKEERFINQILDLQQFAITHKIGNVILSNEGWLLNPNTTVNFADLFDKTKGLNLKIICYLRRIDSWFESAWKQWGLKVYESIEAYANTNKVKNHFEIILNHLMQWESLIGKENKIVRPYEKGQLPKGLIHDFMTHIGIDFDQHEWNRTEKSYNAQNFGFNRDVLEILHQCQELYESPHDNQIFQTFSDLLQGQFQKKPFESYNLLSPEQRINMIQNQQKYEQIIAERYMDRPDGRIFYEPLPSLNDSFKEYKGLSLENSLPILVKLIHSEYQILIEQQDYLNQLTHTVNEQGNFSVKYTFKKFIKAIIFKIRRFFKE